MSRKEWGHPLWILLHSITYNYPEEPTENDKKIYKNFFYNCVPNMILCMYCRVNYQSKIKNNIIKLDNKDSLIDWLIKIHNSVNIITNSKIYKRKESDIKYQYFDHSSFYKLLRIYTENELKNNIFLLQYIEILKYLSLVLPCNKCRQFIINTFKGKSIRQCYILIISNFSNLRKNTCLSI